VIVINSIQYQHNEHSPLILFELTEHKQGHDIWRWKSTYIKIIQK